MMLFSPLPKLYSAGNPDDDSTLPTENDQLTVCGHANFDEGIGRQAIGLIDCLKDDLKINFIPSRRISLSQATPIDEKTRNILLNRNQPPGTVCIFEDILWYHNFNPIARLPKCKINIALFDARKHSNSATMGDHSQ